MARSEQRVVNLVDAAIELHLGHQVVRVAAFGEVALPALDERQRAQLDALTRAHLLGIRTVPAAEQAPARPAAAVKKRAPRKAAAAPAKKTAAKKTAADNSSATRRGS